MTSVLYVHGGGGGVERGGGRDHMTSLIKVLWGGGGGMSRQACPGFHLSLYNFSLGLSFAYLPFCWKTSLDKKVDLADPNKN
jgi:hypothetical protein